MTRISRIISDIGVIRCFCQRIARIARNYFFYHQMNLMNLMAGAMYCLVKSGVSGDYFSNPLRALRGVRWQNNYLLLNKLLSPESKTYELL